MEPVQDLVRVLLESQGYIVRSDTRYKVPNGYSDIDVIAVKLDEAGQVQDRIWGEVKAHLEDSLTPGYLRAFAAEFSTVLDLSKLDLPASDRLRLEARQRAADECVRGILGFKYRQVLYHGGPKPRDGGGGAQELLRPGLEVVWVADLLAERLDDLGHLEGNEPLVRLLSSLRSWGMLKPWIDGLKERSGTSTGATLDSGASPSPPGER